MLSSDALRSLASRAAWTALQAALGVLTVWLADIDVAADGGLAAAIVIFVGTILSVVKSWVATRVGDPDTVTFR